jgi:H+-transporting ATPase
LDTILKLPVTIINRSYVWLLVAYGQPAHSSTTTTSPATDEIKGSNDGSSPQHQHQQQPPQQGSHTNGSASNGKPKGKDLQVEETEHHEHKDEISPELERLLHTDPMHGLDDAEVEKRLADFGPNELKENKKNPILKFLGYFTGAIAYLIEVACIISAVVEVRFILNSCIVLCCIGRCYL